MDFCLQSSLRTLALPASRLLLEVEEDEEGAKEKRRGSGSEGGAEEACRERERQVVEAMELAASLHTSESATKATMTIRDGGGIEWE